MYTTLSTNIQKPELDDREYAYIKLDNELEVLIVHDKNTDKASAAMDVKVGHLSDPDHLPGLAHFCEHLLFMGTKKYPVENDYSVYLSENSGYSNAFTGLDDTNYYFEVNHSALEGALDRFAQFFIDPLFLESTKDREVRAVDSEHKKNLQSDNWRLYQLEKSLSNPNFPYAKFGTGNYKTLGEEPAKMGLDVREELMKWYRLHYSANVMRLVVFGRESIQTLAEWADQKFSGVENRRISPPVFQGHAVGKDQMLKQTFAKAVKDLRSLTISWPFPDQVPLYQTQPGHYISHLIGHEGKGSLLSYLKDVKGWVNHLSAGANDITTNVSMFRVDMDLTEQGLQNYEDIVQTIFQYIQILRETPPHQWIYDELKTIGDAEFRFQEKSNASRFASRTSGWMQRGYPSEWILSWSLSREYNPKLIQENLSYLRTDNFSLQLVSNSWPGKWESEEPIYGTNYTHESISDKLKTSLHHLQKNNHLHLPAKNDFIPTNFETHKKAVDNALKRPYLIKQTSSLRLWHKKDDTFWVPKAFCFIQLRSKNSYDTIEQCVKARFFSELIEDSLAEYSYDADIAGLGYRIDNIKDGMMILVSGFQDKMVLLLEKVLARTRDYKVDADRFSLIKERLKRDYENSKHDSPYQHAARYLFETFSEKSYRDEDKLKVLETLTPSDLDAFSPSLLRPAFIECMVHGNCYKDEAIKIAQLVEDTLKPRDKNVQEFPGWSALYLPQPCNLVHKRPVTNAQNVNSSTALYCEIGEARDVNMRNTCSVLSQIISEPAFDQLRTKEQLGYIVFTQKKTIGSKIGLVVIIQSERDAKYLEGRIEAFLHKVGSIISNLTDKEFKAHVDSVINKKLERLKNLEEESGRYWRHISSGYYEFNSIDLDVQALQNVTKDHLLAVWRTSIDPMSNERRKYSLHMQSQITEKKDSANGINELTSILSTLGISLAEEDIAKKVSQSNPDISLKEAFNTLKGGDDGNDLTSGSNISPDLQQKVEALIDERVKNMNHFPSVVPAIPVTFVENTEKQKTSMLRCPLPEPVAAFETYFESSPRL